jgi:hypothetical protein
MAVQRIDIMGLKQLIRLKRDGYSHRKTADLLHLRRNTGNKTIDYLNKSTKLPKFQEL